jgi:integrase
LKIQNRGEVTKNYKDDKEAISKEDVTDILNECSDIRLKTYVMLLAATGMRVVEACIYLIKI